MRVVPIVEDAEGAVTLCWEWSHDGLCAVVLMDSTVALPAPPGKRYAEMRVIGRVSTPPTLATLHRVPGVQ